MADWAQVVLVVGPAALTGLTGYFIAQQQNRSAFKRQQLELNEAHARQERERRREVRSAPLLAFRAELATLAQSFESLFTSVSFAHQIMGLPPEQLALAEWELHMQKAFGKVWEEYTLSGSYHGARFKLSDTKILAKAEAVILAYTKAHARITAKSPEAAEDDIRDAKAKVAELQELINRYLTAL